MSRAIEKIRGVCKNIECGKEFFFVPSRKQKYCDTACYMNDPKQKRRRRSSLSYLYRKQG